ncbi:MAG: hypothetical protein JNK65_08515, partial [Deltaproteobacteria bacterium]|nr:hypothetical protein [Deltaproteobacteria bacterium]
MSTSLEKNLQNELRLSQQKIESILRSITGCFFVLDPKWYFLYTNYPSEAYLSIPHK